MTTSTHLVRTRRFLPLFVTQLLGAFNDNLFKNALNVDVVLSVYNSEAEEARFSAIASALFIIPFFLLSALAGQLADMRDKARIIRIVKFCEIPIMLVGAIGLRVVMIFFALQLLALPYLKIVGALLLFWIGVKLMLQGDDDGHDSIDGGTTLAAAIKTIIVADAVMSLDNVIAVAGASHGSIVLVTFGILVSIPIVVWGSKIVLTLMDRYPMVITLGAALLGWIGGGMMLTDPATPASVKARRLAP